MVNILIGVNDHFDSVLIPPNWQNVLILLNKIISFANIF